MLVLDSFNGLYSGHPSLDLRLTLA